MLLAKIAVLSNCIISLCVYYTHDTVTTNDLIGDTFTAVKARRPRLVLRRATTREDRA